MPKSNSTKAKDPKRVKAGKKSKTKGDSLERLIAKALQDRYGDPHCKPQDREFQRTPLSGGMKSSYPGDILIPDWFPFTIEAKARRALDLACAFPKIINLGLANPVLKIWESEQQKVLPGTSLLLVIKHWGCDPVVVMGSRDFTNLGILVHNSEGTWSTPPWTVRIQGPGTPIDLTAFAFAAFLNAPKTALVRLRSMLDDEFVIS